MANRDKTKGVVDMSEIGRDNKKKLNKDDNKTNNVKAMHLPAASIFNILHNAFGDGQEIIDFERKYLSGKPKFSDRILIDEEDVVLMKEWSAKYEIGSPKTKHLRKVVSSLGRKKVDKDYHQRMVEWIFDGLEELISNGDTGFEGGKEQYESSIEKLAVLTLELARCDVTSEENVSKKKSV